MQIKELKEFLEKFEIEKEVIMKYLNDKIIFKKQNHYFLENLEEINTTSNNNNNKNSLEIKNLIFLQLKKTLPSKFLLNFIKTNSRNIAEIKSEKQAMNFTYGKNLSFDSIKNSNQIRFKKNFYYLIIFEDEILGYVELQKEDKKHPLKNLMNIGEYLKEN